MELGHSPLRSKVHPPQEPPMDLAWRLAGWSLDLFRLRANCVVACGGVATSSTSLGATSPRSSASGGYYPTTLTLGYLWWHAVELLAAPSALGPLGPQSSTSGGHYPRTLGCGLCASHAVELLATWGPQGPRSSTSGGYYPKVWNIQWWS